MAIDKNAVEHIEGFGPSDLMEGLQGNRRVRVGLGENVQDPFDQLQTAEYTPIVSRKPFPAFNDLRDRKVGTGTVEVVDGWLQHDGTTNPVTLYTRDYGFYLSGLFALAGVGYEIPNPDSGTYEFGYGDGDGNRIGINVTNGTYATFVESAGVRYYEKDRSEWLDPLDGNGPSQIDADISRATLRMVLGWYGTIVVKYYLVISDRDNGTRKVLIDRSEAPESGPTIETPDLPIFSEADGGILNIGGRQYGVLGRYRPEYRNTGGTNSKTIGTTLEPICSFRVKNESRWLGVPSQISGATLLSVENGDLVIVIDGTLTGATFGSVPGIPDEYTSLEYDSAATAISGGYHAYVDNVSGGQGNRTGSRSADIPDIQIPRGQTITLAARAVSSSAVRGTLRLTEQF